MRNLSKLLTSMDRRIALLLGLVVVVVILIVVWTVTGGGSDEPRGQVPAEGELMVFDGGEGGDGLAPTPVLPDETLIAMSVEATLAAVPTPTITPTPDIAATLAADLALNRPQPAFVINPLAAEDVRNPYLKEVDQEYLRGMGGRIWYYTVVWMRLGEFLDTDVAGWSLEILVDRVGYFEEQIGSSPAGASGSQSGVDSVVSSYVETLEEGILGLHESVEHLSGARDRVVAGESVDLGQVARDSYRSLGKFDDSMSDYGCSICGELFRLTTP